MKIIERIELGLILLAALVGLSAQVKADETPKAEYAFQAVWAADMLTTLDIVGNPKVHETNPLIGEHPNQGRVIGYFVAGGALHYGITRELVNGGVPTPLINAWEFVTIGVEAGYVANNFRIGLRFKF